MLSKDTGFHICAMGKTVDAGKFYLHEICSSYPGKYMRMNTKHKCAPQARSMHEHCGAGCRMTGRDRHNPFTCASCSMNTGLVCAYPLEWMYRSAILPKETEEEDT